MAGHTVLGRDTTQSLTPIMVLKYMSLCAINKEFVLKGTTYDCTRKWPSKKENNTCVTGFVLPVTIIPFMW